MVQWLGLGVFTAGPKLTQSLVKELDLISLAVQKKKKVADSSLVMVRVSSVNMTYHCQAHPERSSHDSHG